MTDSAETAGTQATSADSHQPVAASATWAPQPSAQESAVGTAEHPEVIVGAAFAGGLILAMILKRIAG